MKINSCVRLKFYINDTNLLRRKIMKYKYIRLAAITLALVSVIKTNAMEEELEKDKTTRPFLGIKA